MADSECRRRLLHYASFGLAGGVSILTYVSGMSALYVTLGWNLYLAAVLSFSAAIVASYLLNRRVTFVYFGSHRALLRYVLVLLLAQVLNLVVLSIMIERFGVGYYASQAVAIVLITPMNYVLNATWVFRKQRMIE